MDLSSELTLLSSTIDCYAMCDEKDSCDPKFCYIYFCKKFHVQSGPILSGSNISRKTRPAPSRVTFRVLNITLTNLAVQPGCH